MTLKEAGIAAKLHAPVICREVRYSRIIEIRLKYRQDGSMKAELVLLDRNENGSGNMVADPNYVTIAFPELLEAQKKALYKS